MGVCVVRDVLNVSRVCRGGGGAKMLKYLAYVRHESISFPSPHFLDFCIWDTPVCQFNDIPMRKLTSKRKESHLFKITWNWERVLVVPLIWKSIYLHLWA